MPKQSTLDRVTEDLQREIAILQAALDRLQQANHKRAPKAKKAKPEPAKENG